MPASSPATIFDSVESPIPAFVGLYDAQGVLRCIGRDPAECMAYAELFVLDPAVCSLVSFN